MSLRLGSLVEPFGVIAGALGDYLRIDLYFASVIFFFALLYVPTIPRAVDNSTMLATATNDPVAADSTIDSITSRT